MTYHEYEKAVFDWLLKKHEADPSFCFSLRQKATKGGPTDIFIGVEEFNYFGTTFWKAPSTHPAVDLIDLIFRYEKSELAYRLEFNQTKNAVDEPSRRSLQLVQNLKKKLAGEFELITNPEKNKNEWYFLKPRRTSYADFDEMMADVEQDLARFIPLVDAEIEALKKAHPDFSARRLNRDDQEIFLKKLGQQQSKSPAPPAVLTKKEAEKMPAAISPPPLNQIFYGPPGTGKTHRTIAEALRILDPAFDREQPRAALKKRFDELREAGQIAFSTFHQSMSYEDFVEGLKPDEPQDGDGFVKYSVRAGIFKRICERAASKSVVSKNFEKAFAALLLEIEKNGGSLQLETLVHAREFTIYKNSKGNLRFHANTEKAFEGIIKKEVVEHFLTTGAALDWPSYTKAVAKHLREKHGYDQTEKSEAKPHVLIIDEINRGNVSQIFGELITLIEPSKRLGMPEALEATLPYSQKSFGVPPNLYIIGTMNTADRSVEALDTALRRRFAFVEMPPEPSKIPEKIDGIELRRMLETINLRLEVLLDRDHRIGHSYFLEIGSLDKLQTAFHQSILPLLQEYFFGDMGKIGLVLGAGFVEKVKIDVPFAKFPDYDDADLLAERPIFRLKNVSEMGMPEFKKALETLLADAK